jgi:sulfotransferase
MNNFRKFVFLNGLPRSGSTLLSNILNQNEKFHATHTSGCLETLVGVRNQWHNTVEHKAHPNDVALKNVLKAILNAYYEDVNKPVICDKSRGWTSYIPLIEGLIGEKAKILITIRSIPDIMASIEKLHRKTAAIKQPPGEAENFFQMQTIAGRCEVWGQQNSFFGLAYARIADSIRSGFRDRMHFIQFDELTSNPKKTMDKIYDFLEEDKINHDFNNVRQVTQEDDSMHGYIGLHDIRPKVEYFKSDAREILGDELYFKYKGFDFEV